MNYRVRHSLVLRLMSIPASTTDSVSGVGRSLKELAARSDLMLSGG